jgi:hypothetical protein
MVPGMRLWPICGYSLKICLCFIKEVVTGMRPILTVEFHAKDGDMEFEEENVALHSPEELFEFVAPGGGCDTIPDEVGEIRMVIFSGPLAEIRDTAAQILDRAGRGELSSAFLTVIGMAP